MMAQLFTVDDLHEIVEALATALDAKNSCMCGHSERVADISLSIARAMGLSESKQQTIHIGAHLHDLGKIGIPDAILNKPGKLTDEEFTIIKEHPVIGYNIVRKVKVFSTISDIVRYHHERFDGKGYPEGMVGMEIPLGARIVAVADAFDAMTTPRNYRNCLSYRQALAEIIRCRGSQFDPEIVDLFAEMHEGVDGEQPAYLPKEFCKLNLYSKMYCCL